MNATAITNGVVRARLGFFQWRCRLASGEKLLLALGMAAVTGLCAQVKVPLAFTPVPITGQTFAVLLAGVLLGRWWGGISQGLYLALGAVGVPWFAGWGGGYAAFVGPSGGYLLGFVLAALLVGHFSDRYVRARNFIPMLALMVFANFALIHVPGLIQLWLWLKLTGGSNVSIATLLAMGTLPFVFGDLLKIALAAAVTKAVTPKHPFIA